MCSSRGRMYCVGSKFRIKCAQKLMHEPKRYGKHGDIFVVRIIPYVLDLTPLRSTALRTRRIAALSS